MKRRTVSIMRRTNSDRTVTYYLRWLTYSGKMASERVLRTEADPTKARLQVWERQAADARRDKELQLHLDNGDTVGLNRISINEAMDTYMGAIEGRLADDTMRRRRRIIGGLVLHVNYASPPKYVSGITPGMVRDHIWYLREHDMAESTINCYLADLSAWFNWLVDERYMGDNPIRAKDRPKVPFSRVEIKIVGAEGFWELYRKMDKGLQQCTLGLVATTGLRVGEAGRLQWGDWSGAELDIVPVSKYESTKRHTRTLPVGRTTREFLSRLHRINGQGKYIIGTQGGEKQLSTQLNRWLKPFGIKPHNLRQWYRTSMEACECPAHYIDDLMGHRTSKLREAYAGYNIAELGKCVTKFDRWLRRGRLAATI